MPEKNPSITSQILGTRNPGTVVKRRLQNISWPRNVPAPELKRYGTLPPREVPIMTGRRRVLSLIDKVAQSIAVPVRVSVPPLLVSVSDSLVQATAVSGEHVPKVVSSDPLIQSAETGSGDHVPNVLVSDLAVQSTEANGEHIPKVISSDAGVQSMATGSGDYESAGPPEAPAVPAFDLENSSTAGSVNLSWSQGYSPDFTEIWRSQDGGVYSLIDTVTGADTYSDTDGLPSGSYWTYKIRNSLDEVYSDYSVEWVVLNQYFDPDPDSVIRPTWRICVSEFGVSEVWTITAYEVPNLKLVKGSFYFDSVTEVAVPVFSSLEEVQGDIIGSLAGLTTLNFDSLVTVSGNIIADGCANLTTVSMPAMTFHNGQNITFSLCALDAASMNHLMARGVASPGLTGASFYLDGVNNAALTGQGLLDKAALEAAGNFVYVD